jgi:hypothetical protein
MTAHYLHQRRAHRYVNVAGRQCLDTGAVVIGGAHIPTPPRVISKDAETVQAALLEPRTAKPRPLLLRLAGSCWRWC